MQVHPSLARYQQLRAHLERHPADREGMKMNLEPISVPELQGSLSGGCRIDNDPSTHDVLHFASEFEKGNYRYENFLELPPTQSFWGFTKSPPQLVHLSRRVTHLPAGQGLSELMLSTLDLTSGKPVRELRGEAALKEAQKLEDNIPFRLHVSQAFLVH